MPTTKSITRTRKSSRLGTKDHKSPPPLRFENMEGAKAHIKANKYKVIEHHTSTRGDRIQVVGRDGKARTISIPKRKNGNGK